jgi:hypothetical protein
LYPAIKFSHSNPATDSVELQKMADRNAREARDLGQEKGPSGQARDMKTVRPIEGEYFSPRFQSAQHHQTFNTSA